MVFQQQCLPDNLLYSQSSFRKKGKGHFGERVIIHHVIAIIDLPVKSHNNTTTQSTSVKQTSYVKAKTYCACSQCMWIGVEQKARIILDQQDWY